MLKIFRNPRQAFFNFLTGKELEEIHYASLEILERTGLHIRHPEAIEILYSADAQVEDKFRIRIPSHLVKKTLQSAPERVVLGNGVKP